MQNAGLIVAAGRGSRLGGDVPKQYQFLGPETVLTRAVRALLANRDIHHLLVVVHPDDRDLYDAAVAGIADPRLLPPVPGADTRAASARAGLEALVSSNPERVLIHDAARPFVSNATIAAVLDALGTAEGAFPALPVVDALWSSTDTGLAGGISAPRGLRRAQTPQGFHFPAILAAHREAGAEMSAPADDVAVARAAGLTVAMVPGDEANFKITTPADLDRARARSAGPSIR